MRHLWMAGSWRCEYCGWDRNCREDGPWCENCERDATDMDALEQWHCLQSIPPRPGEDVPRVYIQPDEPQGMREIDLWLDTSSDEGRRAA